MSETAESTEIPSASPLSWERKRRICDEQIKPLLDKIDGICCREGIPFLVYFQNGEEDGAPIGLCAAHTPKWLGGRGYELLNRMRVLLFDAPNPTEDKYR